MHVNIKAICFVVMVFISISLADHSFIVIGDPHINSKYPERFERLKTALAYINIEMVKNRGEDIRFIAIVGDVFSPYSNERYLELTNFIKKINYIADMVDQVPIIMMAGDNDIGARGDFRNWVALNNPSLWNNPERLLIRIPSRVFINPGEENTVDIQMYHSDGTNLNNFAFTEGGVRYIFLDCAQDGSERPKLHDDSKTWLNEQMQVASDIRSYSGHDNLNNAVVFTHQPLLYEGSKGYSDSDMDKIDNILNNDKYKATAELNFCGHLHLSLKKLSTPFNSTVKDWCTTYVIESLFNVKEWNLANEKAEEAARILNSINNILEGTSPLACEAIENFVNLCNFVDQDIYIGCDNDPTKEEMLENMDRQLYTSNKITVFKVNVSAVWDQIAKGQYVCSNNNYFQKLSGGQLEVGVPSKFKDYNGIITIMDNSDPNGRYYRKHYDIDLIQINPDYSYNDPTLISNNKLNKDCY